MKSIFSSITAPVTPSRVAHETSAPPNDRANDTRASASPWLAWRSFQMRITQIAISDRKEAFFSSMFDRAIFHPYRFPSRWVAHSNFPSQAAAFFLASHFPFNYCLFALGKKSQPALLRHPGSYQYAAWHIFHFSYFSIKFTTSIHKWSSV